VSTVFPVRVRVASAGARVSVNGVIDDFLTDPLSEITRSSPAPLCCRDERQSRRVGERGERGGEGERERESERDG